MQQRSPQSVVVSDPLSVHVSCVTYALERYKDGAADKCLVCFLFKVVQKSASLPELTSQDLAFISTALRKGKASSNHIRVNVVGNQNVGKTTLVKGLQRKLGSCKDRVACPTEALEIDEINLRCVQPKDNEDTEWQCSADGTYFFCPFYVPNV